MRKARESNEERYIRTSEGGKMGIDQIDSLSQADRKLAGLPYASSLVQVSNRGEQEIRWSDTFEKKSIDWSRVLEHLSIHMDGEVAGSQFDGELFKSPKEVVDLINAALPDEMSYDQYNCAAITAEVSQKDDRLPIGWSGVKSKEEISNIYPDAIIEKAIRMPGGFEDTVDGIEGAWYPERKFNKQTGQTEIILDDDGKPANPRAKFEPKANIARVGLDKFKEVAATPKITVIIVKGRGEGKPMVVTAYPGEYAPAFPAMIDTKNFKSKDSLAADSPESKYWQEHVFIKPE